MTPRRSRISGVTLLALAVLVLLPALAWLQYSWLEQIADADRDRRTRTLQTAASQLAQDFDGEVGKAIFSLQLEPALVEKQAWSDFAERYQMWAESALAPEIVKAVYFVDAPLGHASPAASLTLRVWNAAAQSFETTAWPDELASIRSRFEHDGRGMIELQLAPPGRGDRGVRVERGVQRLLMPPGPMGDEQSVVLPVVRVTMPAADGDVAAGPPDVKLLGFTIIRLDTAALAREVLPVLIKRHLYDERGHSDFQVAVVARDDPSRVLFESDAGAAASAQEAPDTTVPLLGPRMGPFWYMARDARRGTQAGRDDRRPPPPSENVVVNIFETRKDDRIMTVQGRGIPGPEGHWRLVAKHRAGSLEAAVAAARTRNFILSSGILALLAATIGLIVVSARRADRLARQQLEFVAAVSHELRTPVSVIGAAAGNLADGVVDEPARVKKYGAAIQSEARRLGETVERVLQLAGLAEGRGPVVRAHVSPIRLIDSALAATRHEIESAGATVEVAIAPDVPDAIAVEGDAAALTSMLQNLVSNAIKYGGDPRWVRVSLKATPSLVRIAVEDRGLGIDGDDRKHVFEPFYRGREAVARQIQGSGLGLHLVRRIVEAHGGSVSVQSEPGRGSTFTIELPVATTRSGALAAQSDSTGSESPAAARL